MKPAPIECWNCTAGTTGSSPRSLRFIKGNRAISVAAAHEGCGLRPARAMALLLMSAFVGCGGGSDSSEFPVASVERAVLDYYRAQPGLAGEVGRRIEGVKCNRAGTERGAEAFGCTINSVEGAGPVRFLARNDDGRLKVGAVDAGGEVAGAPKDARDAERRLLPSVLRSQQGYRGTRV